VELYQIHRWLFDARVHKLPIAAQDLDDNTTVSFDDQTCEGIPLVWKTEHNRTRPAQGIALKAKAGDPVVVFAATNFDSPVVYIWVGMIENQPHVIKLVMGILCPICGRPVTIEQFKTEGAVYTENGNLAHVPCWNC